MRKSSLTSIVLNSDTIDEARRAGINLWHEALVGKTMILLAPEELKNDDFRGLLNNETFYKRIYALGVDEAHLIYFWGSKFRLQFRQIGFLRARLPCHTNGRTRAVVITATLRTGAPKTTICEDRCQA